MLTSRPFPRLVAVLAVLIAASPSSPARAADDNPQQAQDTDRRIPGQAPSTQRPEPVTNPDAVAPPTAATPGQLLPIPDRWRLLDALGATKENIFDPYNNNVLKGDKPVFGTTDWFVNISAISDTLYEPARVPSPVSNQAVARPGSNSTFGRYGREIFNQNAILSVSVIEGNTAYKPPDFEFRLTPVINYNHATAGERGVLFADPTKGDSRTDSFVGLQELFVDKHLRNVSDRYDFDSLRVGIQPFSVDFRGFLFQDDQFGVRLFGNRDNNLWQYNVAYFRRLQKDTNSGLNDVGQGLRNDDVFIANLYRQDFPVHGFTSQVTYALNINNEGKEQHYDNNGFLVTPMQIGDGRGRNYKVNYFGYNGDGHFGRFNLTASTYFAYGEQDHNPFAPVPQNKNQTIAAFFAAIEPSIDFDWVRIRGSGLFQSGDGNPTSGRATGFDSIFENPQFAGADASYWIRQSIPLIGGGGVALGQRNGILADLRSSKDEGQSNFINPGLKLIGIGADFDVLPELRLSVNANHLSFVNTATLEFLRNQGNIHTDIGEDLSAAITYRPLQTQNVVLRLSGAVLLPGQGLKDLYNASGGQGLFNSSNNTYLYSVLTNLILTY
ncbi:MAG TPA: hypothetical protein VMH36_23100 [Alphaproteobacteria bacterium]|nr:hypothetical protein [Alphaproteobacteria bacterium]